MPEATKSLASARNGDRRMEDSHRESKETRRMRGTRPPGSAVLQYAARSHIILRTFTFLKIRHLAPAISTRHAQTALLTKPV